MRWNYSPELVLLLFLVPHVFDQVQHLLYLLGILLDVRSENAEQVIIICIDLD